MRRAAVSKLSCLCVMEQQLVFAIFLVFEWSLHFHPFSLSIAYLLREGAGEGGRECAHAHACVCVLSVLSM